MKKGGDTSHHSGEVSLCSHRVRMKYLLDGYNILFREKDSNGSLEEQRSRLFEKMNLLAENFHLNFTIVLDSHHQAGDLERHHFHSLEIVYTDFNQTADDYIIEYVECLSSSQRLQTKVVTSDKTLAQKIRFECVEVLSVPSFFKEVEKKSCSRSKKKAGSCHVKLHSKTEKTISSHYDDNTFWLTIFEIREKLMDKNDM